MGIQAEPGPLFTVIFTVTSFLWEGFPLDILSVAIGISDRSTTLVRSAIDFWGFQESRGNSFEMVGFLFVFSEMCVSYFVLKNCSIFGDDAQLSL